MDTRRFQYRFLQFMEADFATAFRLDISQDLAKAQLP